MERVGTVRVEYLADRGYSVWVLSMQRNGVTGWFCVFSTDWGMCSEWVPREPFSSEIRSSIVGSVPATPASES